MELAARILIVEDSETQALQLQDRLENEGWEVTWAASAEYALEELNRNLPDLIIADYHLPGIRGDELCRRVRMNVRTRGVPILMLTMDESYGNEPAGLDSGADDYVSKSVAPDILLLRVRALMRKASPHSGVPNGQKSFFRRARILAIDDSPTYLQHLAEVLAGEGYEVTEATDGNEALKRIGQQTFDCIMVDLVMPRMDGIEVCRRIGELRDQHIADSEAAVIMLTSSETKEDMTRSLEAGADDFVGKSSDMAVLKARIRALLRRKFFQEENRRIVEDLKNKELEAVRSRAEREEELHKALQQAYDDLRQSQETAMQHERLRALGQMASGIAHDINNAVSPVALYTEILLEKEPNLSARTREYLEITQRAIHDVAHTVGRMREFYRLREGDLTLTAIDLNPLVQQVVDLTRVRWSDMSHHLGFVIEVRMDLSVNLPPIAGIESEIREALTNLIFNAVDAMPNGGTLTLRTFPANAAAGTRIQVEVTDTGSGMDAETQRRCLEPFFTTKGERGTGLGLAMVYGVVRRHSGDIAIESGPTTGTTVRLSFLVAETAKPEPAPPPTTLASGMRVLVIDDDALLIDSLRDTLEADGHLVTTARGGLEGIEVFRAAVALPEAFAVVITDLGMPYADGRRVANAIKIASPMTPVILLTGWAQKLIAEGDVPADVDHVLSKPPRLRELREALMRCAALNYEAPSGPAKKLPQGTDPLSLVQQ
jgi:DNA-binding response OmpR family regulator/anti-sigma regulatory factor (Ser/Thr protein kinase)